MLSSTSISSANTCSCSSGDTIIDKAMLARCVEYASTVGGVDVETSVEKVYTAIILHLNIHKTPGTVIPGSTGAMVAYQPSTLVLE